MENIISHPEIAALFIARVFLGLLFFFQGYDKVFNLKISGVIKTFEQPLREKKVPSFFGIAGAWFTSYVEFVCGALLVLGLFKYYMLYLLGIDLILVAIAFGIIRPMWDLQYVFPRLVLLLFLLIAPNEWDVLSIDFLWLSK